MKYFDFLVFVLMGNVVTCSSTLNAEESICDICDTRKTEDLCTPENLQKFQSKSTVEEVIGEMIAHLHTVQYSNDIFRAAINHMARSHVTSLSKDGKASETVNTKGHFRILGKQVLPKDFPTILEHIVSNIKNRQETFYITTEKTFQQNSSAEQISFWQPVIYTLIPENNTNDFFGKFLCGNIRDMIVAVAVIYQYGIPNFLLTDTIRIPLVVASTGELYIPTFFPVSHHPKLKKLFPQISISLDIDYNEFNPGSIFNKIMSSQHRKETSTIPSPPSGYSPIVFYTEEANILKNLIDIRREIDQFFEKKFELESAIGSIQSFLPTLNNFQKFQELEDHKKLIQKLLDDVSQLKLEEAYLSFDKIASKLEELAIRDKKRDFIDSQPDLKDNNPIGYHTFRFNHILTTTESDSPNQKTIRDLFNLLTEIWQKYSKGKALIETLEIKNGYLNELCNICQGNFTASKMNGIFQKFSQNTKTTVMKGKSILTALKKIVQDSQS